MEKNTVKFMRELWTLLLSAQQNASGVPQQFLDEKEAEIQQKKVCFNKNILVRHHHMAGPTLNMLSSTNSDTMMGVYNFVFVFVFVHCVANNDSLFT
jgi:hypothetical protein